MLVIDCFDFVVFNNYYSRHFYRLCFTLLSLIIIAAISKHPIYPTRVSKPRFTVDCVVSRTVSQRLTGDGVICVLNGCGRLVNVCFVISYPCTVDGTLKSKNQLTN